MAVKKDIYIRITIFLYFLTLTLTLTTRRFEDIIQLYYIVFRTGYVSRAEYIL